MSQYVITYKLGRRKKTYFRGWAPIGLPMMGGTLEQAERFPTERSAHGEICRFPVVASVGCNVEEIPRRNEKGTR